MLQKLNQARAYIKAMQIKKAGHNTFSGYDYFTPEQINKMVWEAEQDAGIIHTFSLERSDNGLHGHLMITDIETNESRMFTQATDIPLIKATNVAQQIGGAVTYTLRYMLMTAFDISDNSLDFDSKDNREEPKPPARPKTKSEMPEARFNKMMDQVKANPDQAAKLISMARANFVITDGQEATLADWEDNFNNI